MAEVVNNMVGNGLGPMPGPPRIEMVRNPDFSFPRQPQPPIVHRRTPNEAVEQRPASMHANVPPTQGLQSVAHRRAVSTLPSFTFNSEDSTGRKRSPPPDTPPAIDDNTPVTPSRRGHRRGGSEFVGGDSRLGMSNALSSSPTKASALPIPVPSGGTPSAGRRGHAHRRSAAMSSHDVSNIMQPADPVPRLSQSLPNTPMELPGQAPPLDRSGSASEDMPDPFGPPLDTTSTRPPSRPRVGFDENVVIIPRPLSTISSETESSVSTMRGHSYNNSISSVISMSTPSPQSSRTPRMSLSSTIEEQSNSRSKSSLEISKRIEKEGEWLKSRSPGGLKRPHSEMIMPSQVTQFAEPERPVEPVYHAKKHSIGHALGFDRRRSEPTIGMNANPPSRLSALSLQESASSSGSGIADARPFEHVSSARRIKQWAASKISRRQRDMKGVGKPLTACDSRPGSESSFVAGKVPITEAPVAETNLDAVLGSEGILSEEQRPGSQARADLSTPPPSQHSSFYSYGSDDPSSMLDLDAALGPFKTPPIGAHRQRKELHSNRLAKDFFGPGGHYHRRTESAPAMPPFESARLGTPQSSMADVFEEEEEDYGEDGTTQRAESIATSTKSGGADEANVGVEIVDLDTTDEQETPRNRSAENGLGIERGDWIPSHLHTTHPTITSRLSTDLRSNSIIPSPILEEASPISFVEIVDADDEPRASSLTKSSDSSETPTVLAVPGMLPIPNDPFMTPDTFQGSETYTSSSSPDFGHRQASFDTSRLGTSASSIADQRTLSSYGGGAEPLRVSVDDVPSLTSSRSTMLSTARQASGLPYATPANSDSGEAIASASVERRRKRGSIQSLSQLVGGSFSAVKTRNGEGERPQTSAEAVAAKKGKGERLKRLMFWKAKQRGQMG